jgi:CubicO group peptidase (beta-lactamase class C family)
MALTRRVALSLLAAPAIPAAAPRTRVAIAGTSWRLNDRPTYPGAEAEGLLMNVRMVNAVFEDTARRQSFDRSANTRRFIAALPDYLAHGIRAVTLSLQGGDPGYEGAVNSAIQSDGSLHNEYLDRIATVIQACDRQGAAVILSCFYQRQDQLLRNETAVRAAVAGVARWIRGRKYANVLLEIANEFGHRGYEHPILRSAAGQVELIAIARQNAPGLLISTSGLGDARLPREVAAAADYLTPHLNNTPVEEIPRRIFDLKQYGKAIVVNEDDKTGPLGARSARACVSNGVSWGFMASQVNQRYPFRFNGAVDDPPVYALLRHVTTPDDYFPPPDAEGGWRAHSDSRMDRARLDAAFDWASRSSKNGGLLVLHNGWLVYERYFGLGHRDAAPNLASIGKSFTSIAAGILLSLRPDAFPNGLGQKIFAPAFLPTEAFPMSDPRMSEIRLGHLLAMTGGIRGNNPVWVRGKQRTVKPPGPDGALACVDEVAFGKSPGAATLWCPPGAGYSYATASAHLASVVIRKVAGMELDHFVARYIADPLDWGEWGYGYKHVRELTHTPGGGGIAVRATDMLRFGYLLAREGRWRDTQVVPRDHVLHCGRISPYNPHSPYSLQFDVNTGAQIPGVPRDAFWKHGSGGHTLGIVPSLDLVVWKLGGRDGQYSPNDTGLKPSPATRDRVAERDDWRETADPATAWRQILAAIVGSLS